MRIWDISSGCMIALLLCGASTAFGQSVSANVSATVSAEADSGAVSAFINPMVATGGKSGGAGGHASFLGLSAAVGGENGIGEQAVDGVEGQNSADTGSSQGRTSSFGLGRFGLDRFQLSAPTASQKKALRRLSASTAHQVSAFGYGSKGRSAALATMYKKDAAGTGDLKEGQAQSSYSTIATYSTGFQDSTRGTALINPPDTGTASPLDWAPDGIDYEFPDILQGQFLNPTLSGSGLARNRGANERRMKRMHAGAKNTSSDQWPSALQPSLSDQILNPAILNPPDLQSPLERLDQPLGPQLDQPLGPQ
ncbi:MAG: hypothetical protein WA634_16245 [Silvibacterium sp.]